MNFRDPQQEVLMKNEKNMQCKHCGEVHSFLTIDCYPCSFPRILAQQMTMSGISEIHDSLRRKIKQAPLSKTKIQQDNLLE